MTTRSFRSFALVAVLAFTAGLAAAAGPRLLAQATAPAAGLVADQAFAHLTRALATGTWEPFFDMLDDNLSFSFPMGKYLGTHQGKAKAVEFFRYVSTAFPKGLTITEVMRRSGGATTFVFEFRDEGELRGEPYKNRVAVSFDVCGTRICGYREYFGSDGKTN